MIGNETLTIPFVAGLNQLSLEQVAEHLNESGSHFSIEKLNWPKMYAYRPITTVSAAHSEGDLYFLFQVHGNCLRAACTEDNQNVHEDSCVEFFVKQPDSDLYFNFEFNCVGVCKAARHIKTREDFAYLNPAQMTEIGRWSSIGKRAFNAMNGLFSWELCVRIPLHLLEMDLTAKPTRLLGNFYKCADATDQPHYVTWAPIKTERPDFHRPEFFGEIILE